MQCAKLHFDPVPLFYLRVHGSSDAKIEFGLRDPGCREFRHKVSCREGVLDVVAQFGDIRRNHARTLGAGGAFGVGLQ